MGMASNINVYGKRSGADALGDAVPQQTVRVDPYDGGGPSESQLPAYSTFAM